MFTTKILSINSKNVNGLLADSSGYYRVTDMQLQYAEFLGNWHECGCYDPDYRDFRSNHFQFSWFDKQSQQIIIKDIPATMTDVGSFILAQGKLLARNKEGSDYFLYDIETEKVITTFIDLQVSATGICGGYLYASVKNENQFIKVDLATGEIIWSVVGKFGRIITSNEEWVWVFRQYESIQKINLETGAVIFSYTLPEATGPGLYGSLIYMAFDQGLITCCDINSNQITEVQLAESIPSQADYDFNVTKNKLIVWCCERDDPQGVIKTYCLTSGELLTQTHYNLPLLNRFDGLAIHETGYTIFVEDKRYSETSPISRAVFFTDEDLQRSSFEFDEEEQFACEFEKSTEQGECYYRLYLPSVVDFSIALRHLVAMLDSLMNEICTDDAGRLEKSDKQFDGRFVLDFSNLEVTQEQQDYLNKYRNEFLYLTKLLGNKTVKKPRKPVQLDFMFASGLSKHLVLSPAKKAEEPVKMSSEEVFNKISSIAKIEEQLVFLKVLLDENDYDDEDEFEERYDELYPDVIVASKRAAELGSVWGMHSYGMQLKNKAAIDGSKATRAEAKKWTLLAAKNGCPGAIEDLSSEQCEELDVSPIEQLAFTMLMSRDPQAEVEYFKTEMADHISSQEIEQAVKMFDEMKSYMVKNEIVVLSHCDCYIA